MAVNWRFVVAYLLGLLAAGILAVAAFFKAGDPALFIDQISAHKVTPEAWSPFLAYFFVSVELVAAAAFVAFVWPRLVFGGTIVLMLGFIGVTAWAWAHGNTEGCGCFGRFYDRGPGSVIVEDTVIIIASVVALYLLRGFRTRRWQWGLAAPLVVVALLLTFFGTALPLDGLVVGIGPGSDLSDMAIEGARISIDEDLVLVALVGADCPACEAGMPALKQIAAQSGAPQVLAVFSGSRGDAQAWRMMQLPNFPVGTSPPRVLRQYHRALPAVFLLEDGIVRQTWWNRIPTADEVLAPAS